MHMSISEFPCSIMERNCSNVVPGTAPSLSLASLFLLLPPSLLLLLAVPAAIPAGDDRTSSAVFVVALVATATFAPFSTDAAVRLFVMMSLSMEQRYFVDKRYNILIERRLLKQILPHQSVVIKWKNSDNNDKDDDNKDQSLLLSNQIMIKIGEWQTPKPMMQLWLQLRKD